MQCSVRMCGQRTLLCRLTRSLSTVQKPSHANEQSCVQCARAECRQVALGLSSAGVIVPAGHGVQCSLHPFMPRVRALRRLPTASAIEFSETDFATD